MSEVNGTTVVLPSPSADAEQLALLQRLEEANRQLEADAKSMLAVATPKHGAVNATSPNTHSRKASISSMISVTSSCSNISNFHTEVDDAVNDPEALWELWGKLISDWDNVSRKKNYIKELVRKGIPQHFRGIVWPLLCNAHDPRVKDIYAEYLKQTSPCEKVIRRDVNRTYPEHHFFKEKNGLGQESLFNVIKAYSLHDREVGYCQGSGFIVGLLLMQMPEEEAFAVFCQIMQTYRLRELFKPSMADLGLCMFQLECMIQEQLPDLYVHFQQQGCYVSMFASSWFLTLFATALPIPLACRIFDVFISEGIEIVFRVSFAILYIHREELRSFDMEGLLKFLQKELCSRYEQEYEALMLTAYQVKYNSRKMKKLEKEYNALKSKEQEEQVELRRLRTENRLLRQRIDNLEKETVTLADRLVQDQVARAQKEEEAVGLRREIKSLKQHNDEMQHRLEETTRQLQMSSAGESSMSSLESEQEERIQQLQKEMVDMREKQHESKGCMSQLRDKIRELEHVNQQLQKEPSQEIQQLQEELIASKMREAEAHLAMKELKQHVSDLDRAWQRHQEKSQSPSGKLDKHSRQAMMDELMGARMREANLTVELKDMKQRVMELETQTQISGRQIKRLENENDKLRETIEKKDEKEKELNQQIKELERTITDLESKHKEESMLARIKGAEHSTAVAEMRRRIAELEIQNQEMVTAGQLHGNQSESQELQNHIADLQDEMQQLKMASRLHSLSSLAISHMDMATESDSDAGGSPPADVFKLQLSGSIMCEDGRLPPDPPACPAESSSEEDEETDASKRRPSRRKRRAVKTNSVPGATTPTNNDAERLPVDSGTANTAADQQTGDGLHCAGDADNRMQSSSSSLSNAVDSGSKPADSHVQGNTTTLAQDLNRAVSSQPPPNASQMLVNGNLHTAS